MNRILVTGGNGYIGKNLINFLREKNLEIYSPIRNKKLADENNDFTYLDINSSTNWRDLLEKIDVVVHILGASHISKNKKSNENLFKEVNVHLTKNLCEQAAECNVKKFIFLSSISVHGPYLGKKINENTKVNPRNYYARSKFLAEEIVKKICSLNNIDFTIIRPTTVYGKDAPGNIKYLNFFINNGFSLPFASLKNTRSYLHIQNLIDFIYRCIMSELSKNQIFPLSDNYDLKLKELILILSKFHEKKIKIFNMDEKILKIPLKIFHFSDLENQLFGDFHIDSSFSYDLMNIKPIFRPQNYLYE